MEQELPPQERRRMDAELVERVRLQAQQGLSGLSSLQQLLRMRLKDLDSQLRRCQPADFPALQAKAQLYDALLKELF